MKRSVRTFAVLLCSLLIAASITATALAAPPEPTALYVSSEGNDTNNGHLETPFATLSKAVTTAEDGATIYVLSDLTVDTLARITDKHLTITSYDPDNPCTLSRGSVQGTDNNQSHYNSAMIEVTTTGSEDSDNASSVTLKNIILTDKGTHDGTYFAQTNNVSISTSNLDFVQDGMVTAHGLSNRAVHIFLGEGTVLQDFGGMSALYGTMNAHITMLSGSKICDNIVKDRGKSEQPHKDENGPAGAVWLQGAEFILEQGAQISNVVGRAVYIDSGRAEINGTISGIKADKDIWERDTGTALHLRNKAKAELSGRVENCTGGTMVLVNEATFTMNVGAFLGNSDAAGIKTNEDAPAGSQPFDKTRNTITINGEIAGIRGNKNPIQFKYGTLTIGENAKIHDNSVFYGAIYLQRDATVHIYGKIYDNNATGRGGGLGMAGHGHVDVYMYDGAEIYGNTSEDGGGGLSLATCTFHMNGGKIHGNTSYADAGGVHVRKGAEFIMQGGKIYDNKCADIGGGIAYESRESYAISSLKGGTIIDNYMQVSENDQIANDVAVSTSGTSKISAYLAINNDFILGSSNVYMGKCDFMIENPGNDVKLGNAAISCEAAIKAALAEQKLSEIVGSMWYQTSLSVLPLTVQDLEYDQSKELYAAVIQTDEKGGPVENASVSLYPVQTGTGSFNVTLPGYNENGFVVAFVQEGEDEAANIIKITPADITIYMGGDAGYDAVVGTNGEAVSSNSMPKPLFYVDLPEGVNAGDVVLNGNDDRAWKFELAGHDSSDVSLYYINSTGYEEQDPVRVTYTSSDGQAHISDSFDPNSVGELFANYTIAIYAGNAGNVTAEVGSSTYTIAVGTGTLRVRAVEDASDDNNPVIKLSGEPTEPLEPGKAAVTAPEGTHYTLNDTTVPVNADGVGLLFDSIIDDSDADRTTALIAAIETKYDLSIGSENYQAQYLDLVDAQNGNAWVKASGKVTVYWAYPEGTDENTEFTLYHFTNLHRDGQNSGFKLDDINADNITEVTVELGEYGIAFDVESGGFSPFVLAWETPEPDEPDGPDIPPYIPPVTPSEPDYKPEWLNTEDHYAYIIGYEDGTVRPYGSITRAETATIFFRLLTDEAREEYWTETNSYTDVSRGDWYNTAVSTLSRLGILGGYEDGTFRPNSGITRAEFAKIAVSFFEYEGIEAENVFTDVAHGSWYEDFVAAAAEIGLIEGYEDGSFRPESGITRAEACTIINRTLGRAPDKGHLLPESEMLTWPDNPESAWYYAQIQEATNSHEYKWLGAIEQWTAKLPERDWTA